MIETSVLEQLERLPLFPLPGAVLFPGMRMPLHIFESRYRRMIQEARTLGRPIAMGNLKSEEAAARGAPPVEAVVGVGVLDNVQELPDGRFLLELVGQCRVTIAEEYKTPLPYREVRGELLADKVADESGGRRAIRTLRSLIGLLRKSESDTASALAQVLETSDSPGEISFAIAGMVQTDAAVRQAWLEECDPVARLLAVTDAVSTLVAQARVAGRIMN